jgi:hypothetical protein
MSTFSSKFLQHCLQRLPRPISLSRQIEKVRPGARLVAALVPALALGGCLSTADRISKEAEAKRAVCRQQTFPTNVERARCHNSADARLGEVWGSDLAAVRHQARLVIAERQDRKELTEAEAELEFAKINAQLTSQATRRAQDRRLAEAQYEAAQAQRRSASLPRSQPATQGSFECVSRTVSGDLRTECRDNGVIYNRTNAAIQYE